MKVVIPGGGGFLGRALARSFLDSGDEVDVVLSRSGQAPVGHVLNGMGEPWADGLERSMKPTKRLAEAGFEFQFTKWSAAVNDLISRTR